MAIGTSKANKPKKASVVHCDREIMGGEPVFLGTRVPVKTFFDYLEYDHPLQEFLDDFPSVARKKAIAALRLARDLVSAHARSA